MKLRMLAVFPFTMGLALLLGIVLIAPGAGMNGASQAIPNGVADDPAASLDTLKNNPSLGYPFGITFTPTSTYTVYLPAIIKSNVYPPSCSTAPTLLNPSNGSNLDTLIPEFQWDSGYNPNVTEFYMEIWLDPGLTDWVYGLRCSATTCQTGVHQWRVNKNFDPSTTYYWQAYLMCGSDRGPFSEVWSFTSGSAGGTILPGPDLLLPLDGSTLAGTTVVMQWQSVSGAVEYQVQYSGGGWDRGTIVPGLEATEESLEPNTQFEWWVQARNDYAWGSESAHWHFTTGASGSSIILNPSSFLMLHLGNSAPGRVRSLGRTPLALTKCFGHGW
jgi:hypothetical protein